MYILQHNGIFERVWQNVYVGYSGASLNGGTRGVVLARNVLLCCACVFSTAYLGELIKIDDAMWILFATTGSTNFKMTRPTYRINTRKIGAICTQY